MSSSLEDISDTFYTRDFRNCYCIYITFVKMKGWALRKRHGIYLFGRTCEESDGNRICSIEACTIGTVDLIIPLLKLYRLWLFALR